MLERIYITNLFFSRTIIYECMLPTFLFLVMSEVGLIQKALANLMKLT